MPGLSTRRIKAARSTRRVRRCRKCGGRRVYNHETRSDSWIVSLPDRGRAADGKTVAWPYCRQCRILAEETAKGRDADEVLRRLEAEEEAGSTS